MFKPLKFYDELYRKILHISTLFVPIFLFYYDIEIILLLVYILVITFLSFDILRQKYLPLKIFYDRYFSSITRPSEQFELSGAFWCFMGILLTIQIFPKEIAIPSIFILSLSDSVAALVGIKFGKTKILSKTLEGSIAFLTATIVIINILSGLSFLYTVLISILLTITELISSRIYNDNIIIPLASGSLLLIGGML